MSKIKSSKNKIMVIKLSALGDFIQGLGHMSAIRKHHSNDHITLLTTKPFKDFAEKCGYFDEILIDIKPKFYNIFEINNLRKKLVGGNFSRIYDLQNNDRTSFYLKLFPRKNKPEWIGNIKSTLLKNKQSTKQSVLDRNKQMLEKAGIKDIKIDSFKWMNEDISSFNLKPSYVLFVAGCAPQHPQKRWSKEKYGELAQQLTKLDYQVILLGTGSEVKINKEINRICPEALNLTGKTSIFQIATLAHGAAGAIGNDTGSMHIIGPTGCPTLTLFSSHSNPIQHAPKGDNVSTLQKEHLDMLEVDEVFNTIKSIF